MVCFSDTHWRRSDLFCTRRWLTWRCPPAASRASPSRFRSGDHQAEREELDQKSFLPRHDVSGYHGWEAGSTVGKRWGRRRRKTRTVARRRLRRSHRAAEDDVLVDSASHWPQRWAERNLWILRPSSPALLNGLQRSLSAILTSSRPAFWYSSARGQKRNEACRPQLNAGAANRPPEVDSITCCRPDLLKLYYDCLSPGQISHSCMRKGGRLSKPDRREELYMCP